jgi:hypothetical protein
MSHRYEGPDRRPSEEADRIAPLLRLGGPRDAPPTDRMLRVKAAVHAEWRHQRQARARRTILGWSIGVMAAAAVVVLGLRLSVPDDPTAHLQRSDLATVDVLSGAVRLTSALERAAVPTLARIGDRIGEGDGVDTTSGGLTALRLADGTAVRVDRGTRVRWLSGSVMVLDQGAIYVDSGKGRGARSLEVRTTVGVVRDVGTRFEVRLSPTALRVRVRDGAVRLSQSGESHDALAGDELTLDGSGSVARRTIQTFGVEWGWATALAPPFDLEGRTLREFLDWIAGENGWHLRYADAAAEEKARTTTLHGSILGLTPEEALAAVLPASGVTYRLHEAELRVALGTQVAGD